MQFGAFALARRDEAALLHEAARIAAAGTAGTMAKVLEFRPDSGGLLVCAGVGWKDGVVGTAVLKADLESPAGFAYRNGEAVLSNDLAQETRFRQPALLRDHDVRSAINVPVTFKGEKFGILEVDSREPDCFSAPDTAFLLAVANMLSIAIERRHTQDELDRIGQLQKVQAEELRHRIKNLFTVVHSLVGLADREARKLGQPEAVFGILRDRIQALARASNVGAEHIDTSGNTVDVVELTSEVLQAYEGKVSVTGDRTLVPSLWTTPLGLLLYELATNAAKYGALREEGGRVVMEWRQDGDILCGTWIETGGPSVAEPPAPDGFGSRMLDSIAAQIGGSLERRWNGTGLVVILSVPVPESATR